MDRLDRNDPLNWAFQTPCNDSDGNTAAVTNGGTAQAGVNGTDNDNNTAGMTNGPPGRRRAELNNTATVTNGGTAEAGTVGTDNDGNTATVTNGGQARAGVRRQQQHRQRPPP